MQQLGRGLRKAEGKVCTVLDFVGNHRKEFRFDRRFRALIGGSRDVERQMELGFPFLPAGCHMELEPIAQDIVLRSLREAIPSDWRSRRDELVALGDVTLQTFLDETGLELEDIYATIAAGRSSGERRRSANGACRPPRDRRCSAPLADSYTSTTPSGSRPTGRSSHGRPPDLDLAREPTATLRMPVASLTTLSGREPRRALA